MAKQLPDHLTYEEVDVERWFVKGDFNPASSDHIIKYMETCGKTSRPSKHSKTGKPSTDEATLTRFAKKDPLFGYILQWRKLEKMKGTYVNSILALLDSQSRVHPQFPHNPSTWRLSSSEPNFQNIPQPSDEDPNGMAKQFRQAVVAEPDCSLVSADFSGIEAVLTGWYAGDADYMRLARYGIHSYLTSHKVGDPASLAWDDERLRLHLKAIKDQYHDSDIYYALKRTVHLCLTPEHEVLTLQGWKRLDHLAPIDFVAQWWPTGQIDFIKPAVVSMPNDSGKLIEMKGQAIHQLATPGHRIPVRFKAADPIVTRPIEALPNSGRIPTSGTHEGGTDWSLSSMLACAVQADAALNGMHARFHLHKKRKIERLITILDGMNRHYSKRACKCGGVFISFNYPERDWLDDSKNFNLSRLIQLTYSGKERFINELLHWDGSIFRRGKTVRMSYCSTNKHNAEVAQTIAHLCKMGSLLRKHPTKPPAKPAWIVSFNNRTSARIKQTTRTWIESREDVWCLTVPSSWFLTRFRGEISVTGNTNYGGSPAMMNLAAPDAFPTIAAAEELQTFYLSLCPKLKAWHAALRRRAAKENFLGGADHPYRFKHWFWDVMKFDLRTRGYIPGSDWNRVIAFYPQSTAAGILFDTVLDLTSSASPNYIGDLGPGGRTPLRALIHDEILAMVLTKHRQEFIDKLRASMQQFRFADFTPPGVTDTLPLVIGADVKVGLSWGEMEPA